MLWRLQRDFHDQQGINAWASGTVPWWITCNPRIARQYASVVAAWAQECHTGPHRIDPAHPVTILELGGGTGMFAHRILRQLEALAPGDLHYRYVLTDGSEANVDAWLSHEALAPWLASGRLQVARFDPVAQDRLTLRPSGEVIAPGLLANPLVVIANYFLDAIPVDTFRFQEGQAREGLATLTAGEDEALASLGLSYAWAPLPDDRYEDARLLRLLDLYAAQVEGVVTLPVAGLRVLDHVMALSGGRALVLVADKGGATLEQLGRPASAWPARHGSVSFWTNLHALRTVIEDQGGGALFNDPGDGLVLGALTCGAGLDALPATALMFRSLSGQAGPEGLLPLYKRGATPPTAEVFAALLRESGWDPYVVRQRYDEVADAILEASPQLKGRLAQAARRAWDHYFHLAGPVDTPFKLASLLYRCQDFEGARDLYQASLHLFGPHPITFHDIGLCEMYLDRVPEALRAFEQALELDPEYEPALEWREKALAWDEEPA